MTIKQFELYLNGSIAPLIKDRVFNSIISEDESCVELMCENHVKINFVLNKDDTFSWYVSSFGKEFDDIDNSEDELSLWIEVSYIGESVNMDTLISYDDVNQIHLFESVSDYANNIRKCIECRNWYDKAWKLNIYRYSDKINQIREVFFNKNK